MPFYHQLNLPYPLNPNTQQELYNSKNTSGQYTKVYSDVKKYLSAELLEILASVNLNPSFFMVLGNIQKDENPVDIHSTYLHSDVIYVNNHWVDLAFGINWELTPVDSTWTWWDSMSHERIYPNVPIPVFNGVHYISRGNRDTTLFTALDTYKMPIDQAVLVRTDAVHKVQYVADGNPRISLSLRFPIDQVPTWEKALELLQPLIK